MAPFLQLLARSFNSIYSKFSIIYTLYHSIWFTSHGVQSRSGNTPGVNLPNFPKTNLPPVSLFFSKAVLQLCGPILLARQITSKLVSSFHSCRRIVKESPLSRPPRPGSPSAGCPATWLLCEQPSTPSAGRPPSTPWQRRLL